MSVEQVGQKPAGCVLVHAAFTDIVFVLLPADSPYFRICCVRMGEYQSADGSVRDHSAAFRKSDAEPVAVREQFQNISLEGVVRTACISGGRFDYLSSPEFGMSDFDKYIRQVFPDRQANDPFSDRAWLAGTGKGTGNGLSKI